MEFGELELPMDLIVSNGPLFIFSYMAELIISKGRVKFT